MTSKALITAMASLVLLGCSAYVQPGEQAPKEPGSRPVITDYYAPQVIRPGETWKIFLEVQDRGGDLKQIVANLWQAGVGYYSVNLTPIQEGDRSGFVGYLLLKTPPDFNLVQDRLKLQIVIRDRRGNKSEPLYLPLSFAYNPSREVPEKWQTADAHLLGALFFDVQSSERFNSDGHGGSGSGWILP